MPAATYGQFSPQALDPYPIESTLAQAAYGQYPAEAQTQLDYYQLQRQTAENQYAAEMQQQHEFAKQQLAQQLYEANLKGVAEAKDPTVLQLMASSPQFRSGVMGGIDSGTLTDLVMRGRQGQDVTNLQKAGAGINSISQAGFDPTQAAGSVGITNLGPYAGPALVQAARIRAAAEAAKGGAASGPTISVTGNPEPELGGASLHAGWSAKSGQTPEGARAWAQQHGLVPSGSITGAKPPGTSLQPAQKDEGTARAPQAVKGNQQVYDRVRSTIEQLHSTGKIDANTYADLKNFSITKEGKIVGQSGKTYN